MERLIQLTEDGSYTLFIPEMDEHYHSVHGAIQESLHVFINAGFRQLEKKIMHFGDRFWYRFKCFSHSS